MNLEKFVEVSKLSKIYFIGSLEAWMRDVSSDFKEDISFEDLENLSNIKTLLTKIKKSDSQRDKKRLQEQYERLKTIYYQNRTILSKYIQLHHKLLDKLELFETLKNLFDDSFYKDEILQREEILKQHSLVLMSKIFELKTSKEQSLRLIESLESLGIF